MNTRYQLYRDMLDQNYKLEKGTVFHITWDNDSFYFPLYENTSLENFTPIIWRHIINTTYFFDFWEAEAEIMTMEEYSKIEERQEIQAETRRYY